MVAVHFGTGPRLRHTFASLLIEDGQSLNYVSDQLGHRSIKMTADAYGHLVPGASRQAVNRLPSVAESPQDCLKGAGKRACPGPSGRNPDAAAELCIGTKMQSLDVSGR